MRAPAPRVTLDFEIGRARYRLEKRFLRRPGAELTLPDGRRLRGEPAEEALQSLLAGGAVDDQPGVRCGAPAAEKIWSLLWVGQGQSFACPRSHPTPTAPCRPRWTPSLERFWAVDMAAH